MGVIFLCTSAVYTHLYIYLFKWVHGGSISGAANVRCFRYSDAGVCVHLGTIFQDRGLLFP